MNAFKALLAFFGVAAGVAVAQVPPVEGPRQRQDLAALLNLDHARAARVEAIFEGAREKMRVAHEQIGPAVDETTRLTLHAAMEAIRADTEEKLGAILTEEELARLHAALPRPPARFEAMRFKHG